MINVPRKECTEGLRQILSILNEFIFNLSKELIFGIVITVECTAVCFRSFADFINCNIIVKKCDS